MTRLDPIDEVLALDLGGRGIADFSTPGAALLAARSLAGVRRALIVTGFCVPPGLPETDGPPGAAVLGRALGMLGAAVCYVTDQAVVPTPAPCWRANGPRILWPSRVRAALLPRITGARAGRERPVTIAVGDGGNEIGMGNVRARLCQQGRLMARIASVVRVDHLVVAGTSNWGAYGIVAGLERLTGRALLHTPDQERRLVEACVEAGAVDGIVRSPTPTVDGLPLDVQAAIIELLRLAASSRHGRRTIIGREGRSSMMETQ